MSLNAEKDWDVNPPTLEPEKPLEEVELEPTPEPAPEETKPTDYEAIAESDNGLRKLKALCDGRGITYKKQARAKAIISLLKTHDIDLASANEQKDIAYEPEKEAPSDPFGLDPQPEPELEQSEVIPELTREVVTTALQNVFAAQEIEKKGTGLALVSELLKKFGGVDKVTSLDEGYFSTVKTAADKKLAELGC